MSRQEEQGQPATRRPGTVYDQHDRPWACSIDKKSGFPVGVIAPKGWTAPWIPPQSTEVFKFDPENPTRFRINYDFLLEERMVALKEWETLRADKALARSWNPQDEEHQEALDQMVGPRSKLNAPEIVVACMQGDKWILGQTTTVNEKVAKYLPKKVDRRSALLSKFPDFTAQDEDDLEKRLDIEDEADPLPPARKPKREKVKA